MAGFWDLIFLFRKPRDWPEEMVMFCMWIVADLHAQILGACSWLQNLIEQQVLTCKWSSRPCYVYDNTLAVVELHIPLKFPFMEVWSYSSCKSCALTFQVGNGQEDGYVISK